MNLLSRLNPFSTKSAEIIDTPAKLAGMLGAWYDSDAGVTVTSANALQISTVYQCVRVLSESIGMLPLFLMADSGQGKDKAKTHPLYKILKTAPNDYQTAQEWKEMVIAHLCLLGNHYSYINRVNGKVLELLPLSPTAVLPKLRDDYTVEYQVTFKSGVTKTLEQSEILHFKLFSTDGVNGICPISMGRNALGLLKATEAHGSSLFKNGANPFGGFKTDKNLTEEQFKGLKDQLQEHQGSGNGFKPLILEGGLEWVQVAITPENAQFLETRKFQRSEIAGLFRVPPHMIGDLERATFSNIEHQGLEFVTGTLMPYLTKIESRINVSLLNPKDQANYEAKFNVNALLRGDMKARAEFYTKMLQNGAMSPNEIRAKEDMNPRDGGDIFLTPLNMAVNGQPIGENTDANKE
jgi:HK97 family phage portal protein